jgi:hypothetical protein
MRGVPRDRQHSIEPPLESGEELGDNLVLVAEVIVEIARADLHLVGDVGRRDVRLAEAIEERKRSLDNALARASRAFALRHERSLGCGTPAV